MFKRFVCHGQNTIDDIDDEQGLIRVPTGPGILEKSWKLKKKNPGLEMSWNSQVLMKVLKKTWNFKIKALKIFKKKCMCFLLARCLF